MLKPRPRGIVSTLDGTPLAFAIVRIMGETGFEILHKITDQSGHYYCLIPNGSYNVSIERKNSDQTYTKVMENKSIFITKGYLEESFIVDEAPLSLLG